MKKYKWNYKKFLRNMFNLVALIFESVLFGLVFLGFIGIDIVL